MRTMTAATGFRALASSESTALAMIAQTAAQSLAQWLVLTLVPYQSSTNSLTRPGPHASRPFTAA
ncbi:hypothetical protein D3C85_1625170 [compost metagenome]